MTLSCPTGMKVAGFTLDERSVPARAVRSVGFREAIFGYSTSARIHIDPGPEPVAFELVSGILCRTPDASGSIAENPRKLQRGERRGHICVDEEKLSGSPGVGFRGYLHRGQPVAIKRRSASGTWTQIVSDFGQKGWVRTTALCH